MLGFRRRGIESSISPSTGALSALGRLPTTDDLTYAFQGLYTAQDMTVDDIAGGTGFTAEWLEDGTGGYAHLTWPNGSSAGLQFSIPSSTVTDRIYVKFDLRRLSSSYNTKQLKIYGWGLANGSAYSNFTFGPQMDSYGGGTGAGGVAYSDRVDGGDTITSCRYDGTERGTYSRNPHPTQTLVTAGVTQTINGWDSWEMYVQYNDDATNDGIIAVRKNGTPILQLDDVWNCGVGLQRLGGLWLGAYAQSVAGAVEDYRRVDISYDRPAWVA